MTWTQLSPATSPDARAGFGFAYDKGRDYALLIGGYGDPPSGPLSFFQDTWKWDGTTWTDLAPSTTPTSISAGIGVSLPTLVWDDVNNTVLLWYFTDSSPHTFKTYLWDGSDWDLQTPANSPPGTTGLPNQWTAGCCEAPGLGNVLLFGGGSTGNSETWTWNGSTWTHVTPATTPPVRYFPFMTYDAVRDEVVMYGGKYSSSSQRYDTYTWDGSDWTLETTTIGSSESGNGRGFAFSTDCEVAVRFGGELSNNGERTWFWDGTDWTYDVPATTPQENLSNDAQLLVYDEARTQVVLFGGYNLSNVLDETWVWECAAVPPDEQVAIKASFGLGTT